jgi:hypothetical protein
MNPERSGASMPEVPRQEIGGEFIFTFKAGDLFEDNKELSPRRVYIRKERQLRKWLIELGITLSKAIHFWYEDQEKPLIRVEWRTFERAKWLQNASRGLLISIYAERNLAGWKEFLRDYTLEYISKSKGYENLPFEIDLVEVQCSP